MNINNKLLLIFLLLFFMASASVIDVKIFGTRKDINFLSAEGDIMRPLSFEFQNYNVNFISIDLDSSNNREKYQKIVKKAGGNKSLPFIAVGEKFFTGPNVKQEKIALFIREKAFKKTEIKDVSIKKKSKKFPIHNSLSTIEKKKDITLINIFVAVIVVVGVVIVYYARKNLLR